MSDLIEVMLKGDFLEFTNGLIDCKIDSEQAKKLLNNVQFLEECIFALIAPQFVTEGWDFPFRSTQSMYVLKKYLLEETNYSKDFIENAFIGIVTESYH